MSGLVKLLIPVSLKIVLSKKCMNFFISFPSFGGARSSGSSAGPLSASNSSAGMLS